MRNKIKIKIKIMCVFEFDNYLIRIMKNGEWRNWAGRRPCRSSFLNCNSFSQSQTPYTFVSFYSTNSFHSNSLQENTSHFISNQSRQ